jgi:hypothetical protein
MTWRWRPNTCAIRHSYQSQRLLPQLNVNFLFLILRKYNRWQLHTWAQTFTFNPKPCWRKHIKRPPKLLNAALLTQFPSKYACCTSQMASATITNVRRRAAENHYASRWPLGSGTLRLGSGSNGHLAPLRILFLRAATSGARARCLHRLS